MESMAVESIISAIKIENRNLKFYFAVMSKVNDNKIRQLFYQLAMEALGHFVLLCNMRQCNEDELNEILKVNDQYNHSYYYTMLNSNNENTFEIGALQFALNEKQTCIDRYSELVDTIQIPQIRNVFDCILKETHQHHEMISEEYMRHMNMAHLTDQHFYVRE